MKIPDINEIDYDKPSQIDIKDEKQRLVEAYATVEVVDKDGEIIPIEEFKKIMPIIMDRGGLVMYEHSNKPVGKILNWEITEHEKTGKPALKLLIKVFDHYEFDNQVWDAIKQGKIKGISFGGLSKDEVKTKDGKIIKDVMGYEFSFVENPANPYATIKRINYLAKKAKETKKEDEGYLSRWHETHLNRDTIYLLPNVPMLTVLALVEDLNKRGIDVSIGRKGDVVVLEVPPGHGELVMGIIEEDYPEIGAYIKKEKTIKLGLDEIDSEEQQEIKDTKKKALLKVDDRYLTEEGRFKEMTCPDNPKSKSRFCGCVRAMINEGYDLESAKRICAAIKMRKEGKKSYSEEEVSNMDVVKENILGKDKQGRPIKVGDKVRTDDGVVYEVYGIGQDGEVYLSTREGTIVVSSNDIEKIEVNKSNEFKKLMTSQYVVIEVPDKDMEETMELVRKIRSRGPMFADDDDEFQMFEMVGVAGPGKIKTPAEIEDKVRMLIDKYKTKNTEVNKVDKNRIIRALKGALKELDYVHGYLNDKDDARPFEGRLKDAMAILAILIQELEGKNKSVGDDCCCKKKSVKNITKGIVDLYDILISNKQKFIKKVTKEDLKKIMEYIQYLDMYIPDDTEDARIARSYMVELERFVEKLLKEEEQ